jgi:iron complex outermembrane receptor protein
MILVRTAGCAALLFVLLVASVDAQSPRLHESVVVSAAAEPVPFETVGRAVWVVTRADIERLPIQSFEDLLRLASSVDVRARGPRVQGDLSIRGGGFGQTLVLVDGMRLNDSQSGHHNSDIPLTLDDIERVEVLLGAGSSLFGADALGGTVNVITRATDRRVDSTLFGGEHGLAGGRVRAGLGNSRIRQSLSVEAVRSSGFEYDRDFDTIAASSRTAFGTQTSLLVGHVRKDFGANGFYGPAPSRETTDQTIVGLTHAFRLSSWRSSIQAMYRTHGDHFLYDLRRPGVSENFHRTHATTATLRANRALGARTRASVGVEGGADRIGSNNLGDHAFARGSAFIEIQQRISERLIVYPGLRYDAYSRFGDAWSPSVAARFIVRPSFSVRASAGHAFRMPTFTELYYRDPNHDARSTLTPERGWSVEAGADWIVAPRLMARGTVFARHDRDVIDWIRASTSERWETTNIRRVAGAGVEIGVRQLIGTRGSLDFQYTHLDTRATALDGLLSKYVLEFAPHNLVATASLRVPLGIDVGPRVAWTRRNDGRSYAVVDVRAGRPIGRFTLFVDAANLFDERYQEIVGVAMPNRWVSAGVKVGVPLPRRSNP